MLSMANMIVCVLHDIFHLITICSDYSLCEDNMNALRQGEI